MLNSNKLQNKCAQEDKYIAPYKKHTHYRDLERCLCCAVERRLFLSVSSGESNYASYMTITKIKYQ